MLIICSECGKEYSDQAKSCPNCGAITSQNSYISNNINSYQNNANSKNGSGWLFEIIIFLCILLFLGIVFIKKDSEIVGTWEFTYGTSYTFNEDGTGSTNIFNYKIDFTYKIKSNKISITYKNGQGKFENEYSIKDDKLYLGDDIICTKVK